jgi:hypothetical protein
MEDDMADRAAMREPVFHSHITDSLPESHPLARESVHCVNCGDMLHCFNNECMQTWIESGRGAFCLSCFFEASGGGCIDDDMGLPNA